jgi:hypothetical protein
MAQFIHPPGEPQVFCKGLVSVSIRVYPWLNCVFQVEKRLRDLSGFRLRLNWRGSGEVGLCPVFRQIVSCFHKFDTRPAQLRYFASVVGRRQAVVGH